MKMHELFESHSEEYDDYNDWVKAVRQAGGDVRQLDHDSTSPKSKIWVADGYDGEIGRFDKSKNSGHLK